MFRSSRFGTWGPVVLACVAVTVALRAAEYKASSSRALRADDEPMAAPVGVAALKTLKVPPGTSVQRAYPNGVSAETIAGAADENKLVYSNTLGTTAVPLAVGNDSAFISDDLTLNIASVCALKEFRFRVIGKADPFDFNGGNYTVDWQLFSQCPGAIPGGTDSATLNKIPLTAGSMSFSAASTGDPAFETKIQEIVVTVQEGVFVSPTIWLGVKASRQNVGIILGAPALVGFSSDRLDFPGQSCNANAGDFPPNPHASFWAEVRADITCTDGHPGYHNTQPGRSGFTEGTNKCIADDVHLVDENCQMVALEVTVRGTGLYKFDVRRNAGALPGPVIPNTARSRSIPTTKVGGQVVRFEYNPPITLGPSAADGQRVWVTFYGNNPNAGWILTGNDADLGATAPTYARSISGASCDVANDWEVLPPAPGRGHGGFDVTIYCADLPPKGQCCDMYLTDDGACLPSASRVCVGGAFAGDPCKDNSECGFGTCASSKCVGGEFDGDACLGEVDCKGTPQCRYVPQMNCSFPPRNQSLRPRWQKGQPCRKCLGGTNNGLACESDAQCPMGECKVNTVSGQRPCGVAACCVPDETGCVNVTEKECEQFEPAYTPQTRTWALGRYCAVDGQRCTRNACLGRPGSCTLPRPRKCEGGHRDGLTCDFSDNECRVSCSTAKCVGGPRAGLSCTTNASCSSPGMPGTCAFHCTGGVHDGEFCESLTTCNDDGQCLSFDAEGTRYCVGGDNQGQVCLSSSQCPRGTCSLKACVGGAHAGTACAEPRECRGAICGTEPGCENPFCCTAVCEYEFGITGTTECCDFHWDELCAEIATTQPLDGRCDIAPDNDTCGTTERGAGGARDIPFPGTDELSMVHGTSDLSEPGFCCHNGFAPHCVGGPFDGADCTEESDCACAPGAPPECISGFCSVQVPTPGQQGHVSVWYRFTLPAGPTPVNVEVTTCQSAEPNAKDSLIQVYALSDPDGGRCENLGRCTDDGAACLLTDDSPCGAEAICQPVSQACSLSAQNCPLEASDCVFDLTAACGGLVFLGCNDDAADGCRIDREHNSRLCLPQLSPGQTYIVQIASKTPATNTSYRVDVTPVGSCGATVANDTCTRAISIGDGVTPFNFTNATFDCPTPSCAGASQNDLWWEYTPTLSGRTTIQTCGGSVVTTPDTELAVYNGCACPTSNSPRTPFDCSSFANGTCRDGSLLTFDATAGQCYLVRLGDRLGNRGGTEENGNLHTGNLTITTIPTDCNNNGFADTCDLSCAAVSCAAVPGCGTHVDCNHNGIPDECEESTGCCPSGPVIFDVPPGGVVDARDPANGITEIHVTAPAGAGPQCWNLCETATDGSPNGMFVFGVGGDYVISLDRAITPNACTTITFLSGDGARPQGKFTSHPGNVNGDGTASTDDIQRLIDTLNAGGVSVINAPWGLLSSDIDHSGATAAPDIIDLVNILIGAGSLPDPGNNNTAKPNCALCPTPP